MTPAERIARAKAWILITQQEDGQIHVSGSGTRKAAELVLKAVAAAVEASPSDQFTQVVTITVDPLH